MGPGNLGRADVVGLGRLFEFLIAFRDQRHDFSLRDIFGRLE